MQTQLILPIKFLFFLFRSIDRLHTFVGLQRGNAFLIRQLIHFPIRGPPNLRRRLQASLTPGRSAMRHGGVPTVWCDVQRFLFEVGVNYGLQTVGFIKENLIVILTRITRQLFHQFLPLLNSDSHFFLTIPRLRPLLLLIRYLLFILLLRNRLD